MHDSRLATMASLSQELHNSRIALAACPGRILLVKQQVSLQLLLPRQTLGRLHVAHVPCWYSTPEISACSMSCVSNFTSSILMAARGHTRRNRPTHVMTLAILLCKEGGSQPFLLVSRFVKRGLR